VAQNVLGEVEVAFESPDSVGFNLNLGYYVKAFRLPLDRIGEAALAPLLTFFDLAAVLLDEAVDTVDGHLHAVITDFGAND
jgi:hypothetical protein